MLHIAAQEVERGNLKFLVFPSLFFLLLFVLITHLSLMKSKAQNIKEKPSYAVNINHK